MTNNELQEIKQKVNVIEQADVLLPILIKEFNYANELDYTIKDGEAKVNSIYFSQENKQYTITIKVKHSEELKDIDPDHFYISFILADLSYWSDAYIDDYRIDVIDIIDHFNNISGFTKIK